MANRTMTIFATLLAVALASCGDGAASNGSAPENAVEPTAPAAATAPMPETAASPASMPSPAVAEDLATVWDRFRTALVNGDTAAIRTLTAPTVEQRGELDSTPVVKLTPVKAAAVLAQMAKAPSSEGDGTVAQALAADRSAPKADTPSFARIGDFEFTRSAVGWQLSAFYFEPGTS